MCCSCTNSLACLQAGEAGTLEHKENPQMPQRAKDSSEVASVPSSASQTHITWSSVLLSITTK